MFSSSQLVVGVDIGSHSVKVCQLKRADKAYSIVTLGSVILPEGAVDDGALVEPEMVASAISNLFKNLKIKNKKVGISISGYSVIVKKVNLAVMGEKEMEDHIMTEAEQYIPFDIQDVYIDFQDLKTNKDGYERTDVMLVAAKKEIVDDYLNMLESIGLQATIVDIDGFALENTYEYNTPKTENVALIDIGASKMNINIISKGMSVVARDIVVGSRQLTERIMGQFDLEFEEAEALKLGVNPPDDKDKELQEIYSAVCTQWIFEVKKAIDLYHSNFSDAPLSRIVLSGGGSKVEGLIDYLYQETNIEVEQFNPFNNMKFSKRKIDPKYLKQVGPEMAIASGIAIRPSAI
ncbi:MAG: type IV pilus assembly protein PilM [Desulfofustis sp.]|nr:pilus assembly protein PilM [Desulfofustis sp.]MBT8346668.1 pilus assembly protein PilM [Desulfofustis sp.]NNF46098.1 type IV pilus assembly protein PilM [Desulfofustis sp.]NNK14895.1 type IV pilus assembly protein PilM [Desulfofustis sp.]